MKRKNWRAMYRKLHLDSEKLANQLATSDGELVAEFKLRLVYAKLDSNDRQLFTDAIAALTGQADELARLRASDAFNFGILKAAHAKLEMTDEQSYSLIPDEIAEWVLSHNRFKHDNTALRARLAAPGQEPTGAKGDA